MGKNPTQEEMQKIIANIDPQGEGCVNFEQFMRVSLAGKKTHAGAAVSRAPPTKCHARWAPHLVSLKSLSSRRVGPLTRGVCPFGGAQVMQMPMTPAESEADLISA